MELLKESKKIFIIAGIIFVILFVFILLLALFNKSESNLILNCSENVQMEKYEVTQYFKLYDYLDSRKFVFIMSFKIDEDLMEQTNHYVDLMKLQIENQLKERFKENYSDIQLETITKNNTIEFQVSWSLDEKNEMQMYEVFDMNLLRMERDELKESFEKGGITCD